MNHRTLQYTQLHNCKRGVKRSTLLSVQPFNRVSTVCAVEVVILLASSNSVGGAATDVCCLPVESKTMTSSSSYSYNFKGKMSFRTLLLLLFMPHSCELSVTGFFSLGSLRTKEFVFFILMYRSKLISLYNIYA